MSDQSECPPPSIAEARVQAQCREALKKWQCECERECSCFEYRYLCTLCMEGKPLYPKQYHTLQRLLLSKDNEPTLSPLELLP
jgi:hypothetical protein